MTINQKGWLAGTVARLMALTLAVCIAGLCGGCATAPGYKKPCRAGCGRVVTVSSEAEYFGPYGKCQFCRELDKPLGEARGDRGE